MAATNFTPIILYHTTTASAAPTAGNLNNGELAINITDGKLFYKDNGGTVQVIATKGTGTIGGSTTQVQYNNAGALAGSANFTFNGTTATINTLNLTNALGTTYGGTGLNSYTTGDVVYASGSNTLAKLAIGANTYILTSTGSVPQWSAPSSVTVSTATNLAGGAAGSVPYQSGASTTTFLSIGSAGQVLTSSGSAPQWSNLSSLGVTSLSFGTTGLTPSTATQGAITVAGTLATTNGGTGLTSFTANGLVYATSTSALTTGSALTYVGENLTVTAGSTGGTTGFTASNSAALGYTALTLKNTGASGKTYEVGVGGNGTAGNYQNNLYIRDASGNPILYLNTSGVNVVGNFTSTLDATIYGVTVGRGAGAVSTNTAVGASALAANTTGNNLVGLGFGALQSNTTGPRNIAIGRNALNANTTSGDNTAVGHASLELSTGSNNTAIGSGSLQANTTASNNTAVGYQALYANTTGEYMVAVGAGALYTSNGVSNTGLGWGAGYSTTTGTNNLFAGTAAAYANTTGIHNAALGSAALRYNTTGSFNIAIGSSSLYSNTTASYNTAVGYQAAYSNTTGYFNTNIGTQAGYSVTTGYENTAVGFGAGYSQTTAIGNTFIGRSAGEIVTTGSYNTFIGGRSEAGGFSGGLMTTGSRNTILGNYTGNQGGLDIRTASNYIVLSDGDGNPRVVVKNVGEGEMTVGSQLYTSPDGYEQVSAVTTGGGNSAFLSAVATAGGQAGLRLRSGVGTTYRATRIDFFQTPVSNSVPRWTLINDYDQNNTNDMRLYSGVYANYVQRWKADGTTTVAKTLGVGDAAGSTSGAGITFPATQSASSNANTLDDYEEGTWTPAIRGSGTAGTYQLSTAEGAYVKIGQQVTLTCRVIFGTITGGGTGYMQITGAPSFNNAYVSAGAVWQNNLNMSAGYTWLTVSHVSSSGTTTLYFAESGDELTSNDFPISGVSSGDSFFFTITYITST